MADAKMLKKVPVREQDPKVRATNFEEVCLGYNQEEAMEEAQRCLGCKKPKCVEGCPVSINIPGFIEEIKEGKIEEAYKVIGLSSALPAICGRVCPQESQCEGKCIRGVKGEAVSIGKLERFVADYALEHDIKPVGAEVKNGHKVAVIGSGPSGLTCAGDLAKAGVDRDKEVSFRVVRDFCPSCQWDEDIFAAGVNHFDVIAVSFYQVSHFQGNVQIDVLLFGCFAYGAGVMSAVSGINNHYEVFPP